MNAPLAAQQETSSSKFSQKNSVYSRQGTPGQYTKHRLGHRISSHIPEIQLQKGQGVGPGSGQADIIHSHTPEELLKMQCPWRGMTYRFITLVDSITNPVSVRHPLSLTAKTYRPVNNQSDFLKPPCSPRSNRAHTRGTECEDLPPPCLCEERGRKP